MGLTSTDSMIDVVCGMLKNGLLSNGENTVQPQSSSFDMDRYFRENTLSDMSRLSDDDLLTVSIKDGDSRKAVFVRLGDLKKFLKS